MTRSLVLALGLLIAISGCGRPDASAEPSAQPSPSITAPGPTAADGPVERSASDGAFELVIRSPRQTWAAGEPIEVEAALTYTGRPETVEVTGSGSGLVGFSLEQVDGPLDVEGVATSDCRPYPVVRGEPTTAGYAKSGGWSDGDPNAAAIQAFLQDPVFRLPAGSFVVRATLTGYLGGCGGELHSLEVALPLSVLP